MKGLTAVLIILVVCLGAMVIVQHNSNSELKTRIVAAEQLAQEAQAFADSVKAKVDTLVIVATDNQYEI